MYHTILMQCFLSSLSLPNPRYFFLGVSDRVCCFSCGQCLQDWSITDVPFVEHAIWIPSCVYVNYIKEQNCVRDCLASRNARSCNLVWINSLLYKPECVHFIFLTKSNTDIHLPFGWQCWCRNSCNVCLASCSGYRWKVFFDSSNRAFITDKPVIATECPVLHL
jgi:hypothetical protein